MFMFEWIVDLVLVLSFLLVYEWWCGCMLVFSYVLVGVMSMIVLSCCVRFIRC